MITIMVDSPSGLLRFFRDEGLNHVQFIPAMDDNDLRRLIVTMIGVNYRLTKNEMIALRLFDFAKYMELVYAFVDAEATFKLMASEGEATSTNPFLGPQDGNDIASGKEGS